MASTSPNCSHLTGRVHGSMLLAPNSDPPISMLQQKSGSIWPGNVFPWLSHPIFVWFCPLDSSFLFPLGCVLTCAAAMRSGCGGSHAPQMGANGRTSLPVTAVFCWRSCVAVGPCLGGVVFAASWPHRRRTSRNTPLDSNGPGSVHLLL